MAYGDIGAVIDTEVDGNFGSTFQNFLHVAGNVFAFASVDGTPDGIITTVEISDAGAITDTPIDSAVFGAGVIDETDLIHISGNVYAAIGRNDSATGTAYTVTIADDGTIGAVIDSLAFETTAIYHMSICHVTGEIYAIAFSNTGASSCTVKTIDISSVGAVGLVQDTLVVDGTNGYFTKIINISETVVAVSYCTTGFVIKVDTLTINATGAIEDTVTDSVTIDTANTWAESNLTKALGDVVIVSYHGPDGDGWAKSIEITSAGAISAAPIDSIEFDASNCLFSHVLHIGLGICAIGYQGAFGDGFICTIEVDIAGTITDAVLDSLEFNIDNGSYPFISLVDGDIYAILHRGAGNAGTIKTLDISTPPVAPDERPHHEMMMGMGQ